MLTMPTLIFRNGSGVAAAAAGLALAASAPARGALVSLTLVAAAGGLAAGVARGAPQARSAASRTPSAPAPRLNQRGMPHAIMVAPPWAATILGQGLRQVKATRPPSGGPLALVKSPPADRRRARIHRGERNGHRDRAAE